MGPNPSDEPIGAQANPRHKQAVDGAAPLDSIRTGSQEEADAVHSRPLV